MMNSKNFFYIALSIGILIFSADKIYKTWNAWQNEKVQKELEVKNRLFMDNLYQNEFDKIYYRLKTEPAYQISEIFGGKGPNHDLEMLEKKMVADGYTHAEVGIFKNKACAKYKSVK